MLAVQVVGLYSASVPGPEGPDGSDKVGHLLAFAGEGHVDVGLFGLGFSEGLEAVFDAFYRAESAYVDNQMLVVVQIQF